MDDNDLRDKIVKYFIGGLLVAVVAFLIFGLARGDGGDDSAGVAPTPAATPPAPAELKAQVGCQQPTDGATTGKSTIPPNPGVTARKAGATAALVAVTIPTSTEECRVAKIRVQLDSAADDVPATTKTVNVMTGPPVRRVLIKMRAGSSAPQTARASAITQDGSSSSGATVSVR